MVLETIFDTNEGSFALIDFMPMNVDDSTVVRIVEGRTGRVVVRMNLTLRFDYGSSVPWVSKLPHGNGNGNVAIAGPNLVVLRTSIDLVGEDLSTTANFETTPNRRVAFTLSYGLSHKPPPAPVDGEAALNATVAYWQAWSARCSYKGDR